MFSKIRSSVLPIIAAVSASLPSVKLSAQDDFFLNSGSGEIVYFEYISASGEGAFRQKIFSDGHIIVLKKEAGRYREILNIKIPREKTDRFLHTLNSINLETIPPYISSDSGGSIRIKVHSGKMKRNFEFRGINSIIAEPRLGASELIRLLNSVSDFIPIENQK